MTAEPTPTRLPPPLPTAAPVETPFATPPAFAGFWPRVAAAMLDGLVLAPLRVAAAFIALLGLGAAQEMGLTSSAGWSASDGWIFALLGFAMWASAWPYYAFMESAPVQATVGKLALGLRVHDDEALGRPSFWQATVRFVVRPLSGAVLGLGYLMMLVTRQRQTLHDWAAACVVLRKPRASVAARMPMM